MIKLTDLLNEIGDSSAGSYDFQKSGETEMNGAVHSRYSFDTDSGLKYGIGITKFTKTPSKRYAYEVAFAPEEGKKGILTKKPSTGPSKFDTETNRGEQYRIMATVVAAVKREMAEDDKPVDLLTFLPSKRSKTDSSGKREEDPTDNRRLNLFKAYVEKNVPNAKVRVVSGTVTVDLGRSRTSG